MPVGVDFGGSERVEALWGSMVEFYGDRGIGVERLKGLVNKGYPTSYFPPSDGRKDIEDKAEAPEITEFCYGDRACHHLLCKHGFPVPMAMDDFDDSTEADARLREEIGEGVSRVEKELLARRGAPSDGTDVCRREMALRVGRFVQSLREWKRDCRPQTADGQEPSRGCVSAAEVSAALFFAYNQFAGLNPMFLIVKDFRPTIDRLSLFAGPPIEDDAHILVGIPLSNGNVLQIDPSLPSLIADYAYARPLSARQFASAWLENEIESGGLEKDAGLRRLQLDLVPDEPRVYLLDILERLNGLDRDGLDVAIREMHARYGSTPLIRFYEANIRRKFSERRGATQQELARREEELHAKLDVLCDEEPELASVELAFLAEDASGEEAFKLMKRSVMLNPNYYVAVGRLHELAGSHLNHFGMVGLYEELVEKFPKHSHFRWRLAEACLLSATEHGEKSYLKRGLDHAGVLAQRLEPARPESHYLFGRFALLMPRPELAKRSFEMARRLLPADSKEQKQLSFYSILAGLQNGDEGYVSREFDAFIMSNPGDWARSAAAAFLTADVEICAGPYGEDVSPAEVARRARILLSLLDRIASEPRAHDEIDLAYIRWGLMFFRDSGWSTAIADQYMGRVSDIEGRRVQNLLYVFLDQLLREHIMVQSLDGGEDAVRKCEGILAYFERNLKGGHRRLLVPAYAHLARHALSAGDVAAAGRAFEKAMAIDPQKGADVYFEAVVRELYSPYDGGRSDSANMAAAEMAFAALDILWKRRDGLSDGVFERMGRCYGLIADDLLRLGMAEEERLSRLRSSDVKKVLEQPAAQTD